ncbi:MAG: CRTAC1 family protein [Candidatus Latescibacterota bacterium]|nr:CRTAC1 family protein [Candidatus Latescibacterota bacterium]
MALAISLSWSGVGAGTPVFTDVTVESGIDFVHTNGATGRKYVIETVGPGAAFLDVDADGDLDVYLLNGAPTGPGAVPSPQLVNRMYRNSGAGTFVDRTAGSGLGDDGYGMGSCAADVDNDGDLDVYVTNFGPNRYYENDLPAGRFVDRTAAAAVGDSAFSTGCAFADVDADGFVDLYVANYHDFSYANHKLCAEGGSGLQLYCGPESFNGVRDHLFRNQADGTFTDETEARGLLSTDGKELGVVFGDIDLDGDPDLYLANDKTLNFLYLNKGGGHFDETGLLAGVAYNEDGDVEAGMGVHLADYDGDMLPDLLVTNFQWETNTLYRNVGGATFLDETFNAGFGKSSIPYLSWGTQFFDVDNDGDRDAFIASGHLESDVEIYENTTFAQRNQLFLNDGSGRFEEITPIQGSALDERQVSRGAAFGDYDDDGDIDILVANVSERPQLLRNDTVGAGHWLRLRLEGTRSNHSAIGARVTLKAGSQQASAEVATGGSYLSQSDLRLHFGFGSATVVDSVSVSWPSGVVQVLTHVAVDQQHVIREVGP